jgi:O-antigen/teichoic acid export membrane protein
LANKTEIEKTKIHVNEALGSRTASVASLMVFGRFIALILSGIAFIVVARVLGPSVYGVYVLAISFAGFFGAVADLGISTAMNKFIGQYYTKGKTLELEKVISNGYVAVVITSLIFTLIAFFMSNFIAVNVLKNPSQTLIIQVVSFAIFGAMMFSVSYNSMVGFGKGKYVALVIVMQSMFQAIFSIGLALAGLGALAPILGIMIGYVASVTTVLILLRTKFKIKFRSPSFTYIKRLLKFSSPISVYNGLRGFITNIAPIVLVLFATTVVVGNFGVAVKTSAIISNVTDALGIAVLPMFAYTAATKSIGKEIGKFYNYASYLTYVLITPALLYLAILSKQFSYTIFSAKYLLAPSYIMIISVGTLLWVVATYTTMLLVSTDRVKEILKYSIIIAAIELVMLITLTYFFGGIGLTFQLYIITPFLIIFFMEGAAHRMLKVRLDWRKLARVVIAGVISIAFVLPILYLLPTHYITTLFAAAVEQAIIYPAILALSGAAGKEELKIIRGITAGIPVMNKIISTFANYSEHFVRD